MGEKRTYPAAINLGRQKITIDKLEPEVAEEGGGESRGRGKGGK